jgi:hypothetical protein
MGDSFSMSSSGIEDTIGNDLGSINSKPSKSVRNQKTTVCDSEEERERMREEQQKLDMEFAKSMNRLKRFN